MLGIATLSDPVQKPLLQDDLFDAEYSSSEDENDKSERPQQADVLDSLSSSRGSMQLNRDTTEKSTEESKGTEMDDDEKDDIENKKKSSRKRAIIDDDEDSSDDEKDKVKSTPTVNGNDVADDEKDDAVDENGNEDDGEEDENGNEENSEEDEQARSDDEMMARPMPMERAKSKKQKASERQNLSRRVKQQAIEQIHSESQRIIRESKLTIPYHKPKPLSLNEFFSKKPTLNQVKAPQAVSRILQCNRKDTPMPPSRSKNSLYNRIRQTSGKLSERTMKKPGHDSNKSVTNSDIKEADAHISDEDKLVLRLDSLSDDEDLDMKLPEIDFNKTDVKVDKVVNYENNELLINTDKLNNEKTNMDIGETRSVDKCEKSDISDSQLSAEPSGIVEPALQVDSQDWSLRLDTQTLHDTVLPESDSEMETLNTDAVVTSLSDIPSQQSPDSELATVHSIQPVSELTDRCQNGNDDIPNDVTVTPVNKTIQLSESTSHKKRLLEKLKGFDMVVPKLGGDGESMIMFDDDVEQSNTGVFTLMERFVKHSTKKTIKRKSRVQIEVVKKEVNSEGKEELVHELVPVTLGEDEQQDAKLETPGAKLLKLKENLQVKMKVQREVERQRRIQVYKMDNEEGFEEQQEEDELPFNEEEEEAELTDGSETDGDYVPDEAAEEDDDDEDDSDSEQKLKKNRFLDAEAKDDDMDELPSMEINHIKPSVVQTNEDNDSNDEFVFKIRKKKKKMVVDDDEDEEDEKCDQTHDSLKNDSGYDLKLSHHDDASTISSSSVKSLFKNPIRYSTAGDGKTMDLFDSSTNTTDPSGDAANLSIAEGLDSSAGAFSFTPIKDKTGLIRHKSTDFANTPDDSDEDERKDENAPRDDVDSRMPLACSMGLNSSFDNSSAIPPYQRQTSSQSASNIPSNQYMSRSENRNEAVCKMGELTLPVEDSQDLFQQDFSYPQSLSSTEIGADTQNNLHLSFEDNTQTQFLDEDGFLKVKTSKAHQSIMSKDDDDDENAGDMDELLGLCSGQFTATAQPSSKPKKGVFSQLGKHDSATQDMDELLQLCSGTFTGKNKPKETDDDAASESSFRMLSDNESVKDKAEDGFSDDEEKEEEEGNEDEDMRHSDTEEQPRAKKILKNNFIEEEAELSGSEFGSDEEYDAEEFGDLMAEQMINEDVGNEDEIHDKIQKMHMKLTEDEDARTLRLYKEAFLTDGDLHDGTKGRTRQFRWRNVDDDSWTSGLNNNSDDEAEEDENENEVEWRKQRHEREQCLKDQDNETKIQDEEDCLDLDENSQFDKFIKKVSVKSRKKSTTVIPTEKATVHKSPSKPKKSWFKHGSFLNRAKNDLDRITNMFKPLNNPSRPRNGRNFVFQSLSPEKTEIMQNTSASQMKRPLDKPPNLPRNKKPKLSASQPKQAKSIFQHI